MLTLAAVVFAVSSASAQGVEVGEDVSGAHCGTVTFSPPHATSGGCEVDVSNSSTHVTVYRHTGTGEVVADACDNTFRMNIDEGGEGYFNVVRVINTGESPGCGFVVNACDVEASGDHVPWRLHFYEPRPGVVHAISRVCYKIVVVVGPPTLSCEVEGDIELALTKNFFGRVVSAELEGSGQGAPITNRVVVAHGAPHATCEGIGAQAEVGAHWVFSPSLRVTHL